MLPIFVALAVAAAPAPPADPAPDTAITVTGERLTDAQISQQANNFIRSILPPNPQFDQYARWSVPICLKVTGIADVYAAHVADRIRAAATTAGIALARPGCRTNLSVVFSPDARITAAKIVRKKPKQIDRLNGIETDTLLKAALPVRWWHVLGPGGGEPAGAPGAALMAPGFEGGGSVGGMAGNAVTTNSYSSSLIDTHIAVGATSAVAIVDLPLATGKSLDALSDYVAMVMLVPSRLPPAVPAAGSILALFGDGTPPAGLTNWDRAFLAALYRIQMNRTAIRQRGQLATRMAAEIKADPAPQ